MAPISSNQLKQWLARALKVAMVALLVPLAIGLLAGVLGQLDVMIASGGTVQAWVRWGVLTYAGIHLLLVRPVALFRASHALFSGMAVWLFGSQVSSVQQAGGGKAKGGGPKSDAAAQGSTLVAFSPYVVPLYVVLTCATGWLLGRWLDRVWVDGPVSFLLGFFMAFHWLMTAEDLQGQRSRWHFETYLLALGLVFVLTLLVAAACLPWAVPDFSFVRALSEGLARAQEIYATNLQRLFL
jgi:hypothetical protein